MLQHDDIYPMHCVYVDSPGDTVHLQVPLGESVFCELLKFGYRINDMFVLVFLVNTSHVALQICPYNAIKFLPRQQHITEDASRQLKQSVGKDLMKSTIQIAQ